jgi:hypothetical protein
MGCRSRPWPRQREYGLRDFGFGRRVPAGFEGNELSEQILEFVWQRLPHSRQILSLQPATNGEQRLPHEHCHGDLPYARFEVSSDQGLPPR